MTTLSVAGMTKSQVESLLEKNTFTSIPDSVLNTILSNKSLNSTEKNLMVILFSNRYLSKTDEIVNFQPVSVLAKLIGVSSGTCSETLKSLTQKGWITQETSAYLRSKVKKIIPIKAYFDSVVQRSTALTTDIKPQEPLKTNPLDKKEQSQDNNQDYKLNRYAKNLPADSPFRRKMEEEGLKEAPSPSLPSNSVKSSSKEKTHSHPTKKPKEQTTVQKTLQSYRPISTKIKTIIIEKVLELKALKILSVPEHDIYNQIVFSITAGTFRHSNPLKAIRAISKLIKSGAWRIPAGFIDTGKNSFSLAKASFGELKQ